jgi:transketolase
MPYKEKFQAFRWQVITVDGHDFDSLIPALSTAAKISGEGPVAVIANTVKGKGISFMEGNFAWHGKAPNNEQLAAALKEIEEGVLS